MLVAVGCSDNPTGPLPDAGVDVTPDVAVADTAVDAPPCSLQLSTINGQPVNSVDALTAADDQDPAAPGIQIDLAVTGTNLPDGREVSLNVTQLTPDLKVAASGGEALFSGVTVQAALQEVLIEARADGCSASARKKLTVTPPPECFFVDPRDGDALIKADDKDPSSASTFEYDVVLTTTNAAGGQVSLLVGQAPIGTPKTVDAQGRVVFADTQLDVGDNVVLTGTVKVGGVERTCKATVSVTLAVPACSITFSPSPIPTPGGKAGLGLVHDADTATPGMQVNIGVITGTLVDTVALKVDGVEKLTQPASGGKATFAKFALSDGPVALQADCIESTSGNVGLSPVINAAVDSVAPGPIDTFDCAVLERRKGSVECCFTAIADSGTGMKRYEIRRSPDGPITAANWNDGTIKATTVEITAPPTGNTRCQTISQLALGRSYYFAIRGIDGVDNVSTVSPSATTPVDLKFIQGSRLGPDATSAWGSAIAAGDYNCDGSTDLAVGNPSFNGGMGRVSIFLGNPNGFLQQPEKKIEGTVAGGNFGASLAALPNFDAALDTNNCTDLAVLAAHTAAPSTAKVYVYLGQAAFFQRSDVGGANQKDGAELVLKLADAVPVDERLVNIFSAGDVDNDGASDLAITHHDVGVNGAAEVLIVYGEGIAKISETVPPAPGQVPTSRELPGAALLQISGGLAAESFGASVCGGATLDGGDYDDLVIGAEGVKDAGATRGAVYTVLGANRASSLPEVVALSDVGRVRQIKGGSSNGAFGHSVGIVGDMNGDGTEEFVVSDPTVSLGANSGEVYVFRLASSPATPADAVWQVKNNIAGSGGDQFGFAVGCSAETTRIDLNGDSRGDLLVTARGAGASTDGVVYLFNGANPLPVAPTTSTPTQVFLAPSGSSAFGQTLLMARDINNDGFIDFVVGDPQHNGGHGRITYFY